MTYAKIGLTPVLVVNLPCRHCTLPLNAGASHSIGENEAKKKNLQDVLYLQDCLRSAQAHGIVNNGGEIR